MANEKPHWDKLKDIVKSFQNCEITFKAQDGLPIKVLKVEGKRENIDLIGE